ncbi:hypothetical protein LUZ60_003552 [Juncus effusus]|nr:hypothetical protein LUZ60_003552 [Juncus effusus]
MHSSTLIKSLSFLFLLSLLINPSVVSPPQDPVHCTKAGSSNCTFNNAYGTFPDRSTCHASKMVYPSSEEELTRIVANTTVLKRKMKVVTRFAHSIPKLACSGGSDRDPEYQHGPYWSGLTIGGLLSTGVHRSSLWGKGSAVHEYVVSLRLFTPAPEKQGFAMGRVLKKGNPDLDAAEVSIGVLGVISQVTLQLEPMFKRSLTFSLKGDSDLAKLAATFAFQHEFADILWYPGHRKALYRLDDHVPVNTSGKGVYGFIGFRPTLTSAILANRIAEVALEAMKNAKGKCSDSKAATSAFAVIGYGLTNNGLVIRYQNKMQSASGCAFGIEDFLATACPRNPRIKGAFFRQTGISISLDQVEEFLLDFQKLRDLNPEALCGLELYDGVLMRYVKASSAYLGKESRKASKPRLYEDFIEEIEQMALFKYNGLPHWGKNRNVAFQDVIKKYTNSQDFIVVKEHYDPNGLFSSEWSDQILGFQGSVVVLKERCGLEGLCVCKDDSHCAPNKGYYCKPRKV